MSALNNHKKIDVSHHLRLYLPLAVGIIIVAVLYLIRYDAVRYRFQDGDRVRVTGTISEEPRFIFGKQQTTVGQIHAQLEILPTLHYGEKMVVEGVIKKKDFGWVLDNPKVLEVKESGFAPLLALREKALEYFKKFLPEPHASLAIGMILGTKSSLDSQFFEALRNTGTLHVVVASGTNISFVAIGLMSLFVKILGRKKTALLVIVFIWIYVVLVGFQAPIVRAGILGSIAFLGLSIGREFNAVRALIITAVVMLLVNPLWLLDVGFQLSFSAILGIMLFGERIAGLFGKLGKFGMLGVIRQDLATTLAAQIFVTPIIFFNFGQVSLISPLVNTLVLWTVQFIMALGFITLALAFVWEPLGRAAAGFLYLPLEYFVRVVGIFGGVR